MLNTFVDTQAGTYLNTLRRFVLGGSLVPSEANSPIKIPVAAALANPGRSNPIPIEGPQDAFSEIFALHGATAMRKLCVGVINVAGGAVAVVGTNTTFLQDILPGDTIICVDDAGAVQTRTVAAGNPTTNVNLNVTALYPVAVTNKQFVVFTPDIADVNNRMRVDIYDVNWTRKLMNRPTPVGHVFGNALRPELLRWPALLQRNQMWLMTFENWSLAGGGSFFPVMTPRKWQMESLKRRGVSEELEKKRQLARFIQPYWLTNDNDINIADIGAANNTGYAFFTNTGDVTLYLFDAYITLIANGPTPINANDTEVVTIELMEVRTGRTFQSQPLTPNTGFGTAQFPFRLPGPIILDPRNQIKATIITNYTNIPPGPATNTELSITFGGVAILQNNSSILNPKTIAEAQRLYQRSGDPRLDNCPVE